MKKTFLLSLMILVGLFHAIAQTASKGMTAEQYDKAKTFTVKDLDNDTYVKIENLYVLDRYEGRKPYFITGSDGLKKRMDIYKVMLKEGMQELGTLVFYTNEKGQQYKVVLPNMSSEPKIWEKTFEDIDKVDQQEKFFALKLSYVLSKEFSFQLFKAANGGKDMGKESETYGNDICFPGTTNVAMAGGIKKQMKDIQPGDDVVTVDPVTGKHFTVKVKELTIHEAKNYAITNLSLVSATKEIKANGTYFFIDTKELSATPNHPVVTSAGEKKIGQVTIGEKVLCQNEAGHYQAYDVVFKQQQGQGKQQVYNIIAESGSTFVINEVMVLQKAVTERE
ncbi:MAG: Hint domain-containing protein [Chitinophagaceae bacterium]